ncbi:hypothetical protein NDU88_003113 [Pleurodeles waltl]|uniref:Uncharacterized protein n=1 Tax=Pleurodeles waltl TaxID=8319 RepID=A0AAV7TNJ7_PLEWA|nr:hypothetical protein NDU88_003113 [Pleurodeles waltl]
MAAAELEPRWGTGQPVGAPGPLRIGEARGLSGATLYQPDRMSAKHRTKGKSEGKSLDGDKTKPDMAEPAPPSLQDTLDKILGAIEESKTTLQ